MALALGGIFEDLTAKLRTPLNPTLLVGVLSVILVLLFFFFISNQRKARRSHLPPPPAVPGLPIFGNLLQLKERKPHKTFAGWAETYGPIYSIQTGANTLVVLNSTEVAKEAMVTRFSSISTRKLSSALQILSSDKCMVAASDYNEFYKNIKRHIVTSVLGANAQKRFRGHRDTLVENVAEKLHSHVKNSPNEVVNFRAVFEDELFGLALKEAVGEEIHSIRVEELGTTLSKKDIFKMLVTDFMEGAIAVDWRDFFPYLKWLPNKSFEQKIRQIVFRRDVVMKALITGNRRITCSQKDSNCYLDYLLSETTTLPEEKIATLVWESILETSDTTLVTTEWALFELARAPSKQDRLYQEIRQVCGLNSISEENLSQIPYLNAVFQETLRKHSPVPIVPIRYAHEDTQIGGYFIPKGTEIAINIYGCNMDKKQWETPEAWIPERFLGEKKEASDMHKTMAFGAGKRVCAGSFQVMAISCVAIGRMVQQFEWTLSNGEEDNVDTMKLTTTKLHPLKAILKPRN